MKTGGALVVLLLVFLPLAAGQESALLCYDGPFESVLLNGCVDDCRSFETLAEAEQHCNAIGYECGGITKSAYGDAEAISLGVGLYEVRAGPGIEAKTGDMSWIKQVDCAEAAAQALTTPEQSAISQINSMVAAGKLMPDQSGPGLTACYDYSAPVQGEYLDGCVDGCHSFRTLQAPSAPIWSS